MHPHAPLPAPKLAHICAALRLLAERSQTTGRRYENDILTAAHYDGRAHAFAIASDLIQHAADDVEGQP